MRIQFTVCPISIEVRRTIIIKQLRQRLSLITGADLPVDSAWAEWRQSWTMRRDTLALGPTAG